MIDFHTHILPGMDDGSKSVEESLWMLEQEYRQGATRVIATPHFYAARDSIASFQKRRGESYAKLESMWEGQRAILEIYMGAEVFYFPNMGEADKLFQLCIGNTSVMLLELPFTQWTSEMKQDIEKMITKQGLTIILAHVERYYELQRNKNIWQEILALPLYAQLNADSFLDRRRRRFSMKFLLGHQALLGSDCHNSRQRAPNLLTARMLIQRRLGVDMISRIDELGAEVLDR